MKTASSIAIAILVAFLTADTTSAADVTTGPESGTLVLVGGGDRDNSMFRHFVRLAGGRSARLVIVPTAASSRVNYDYINHRTARYAREELKMKHVVVAHTHNCMAANSVDFVRPIQDADALWFTGGRQWRLADAYLGTLAEKSFRNVLKRGGVIGGSSAGASIQGSFLVRGDTKGSRILIGDHQQGFGFIRNSAIDQHLIPRRRQHDLIRILSDPDQKMDQAINRNALLGIGIDEATAIVVKENEFEVIGRPDGVVLVYDPTRWTSSTADDDRYLTLSPRSRYDLKRRTVIAP